MTKGAEIVIARDDYVQKLDKIGQRRPVTIYRLIARRTVEERVLDLHREKQLL